MGGKTQQTRPVGTLDARRLELYSRRDSYFKLLNLIQDPLGSIARFHYSCVLGPSGTDDMISNALLRGSAIGRQYRIIKCVQGDEVSDLELYV